MRSGRYQTLASPLNMRTEMTEANITYLFALGNVKLQTNTSFHCLLQNININKFNWVTNFLTQANSFLFRAIFSLEENSLLIL